MTKHSRMTFAEAVKIMAEGGCVSRTGFALYAYITAVPPGNQIYLIDAERLWAAFWVPTLGDLQADDWGREP